MVAYKTPYEQAPDQPFWWLSLMHPGPSPLAVLQVNLWIYELALSAALASDLHGWLLLPFFYMSAQMSPP